MSAANSSNIIRVGTLNVRTFNSPQGKEDKVEKEKRGKEVNLEILIGEAEEKKLDVVSIQRHRLLTLKDIDEITRESKSGWRLKYATSEKEGEEKGFTNGIGVLLSPEIEEKDVGVVKISKRLLRVKYKQDGKVFLFFCAYSPPVMDYRKGHEHEKKKRSEDFYTELREQLKVSEDSPNHFTMVLGYLDCNEGEMQKMANEAGLQISEKHVEGEKSPPIYHILHQKKSFVEISDPGKQHSSLHSDQSLMWCQVNIKDDVAALSKSLGNLGIQGAGK